MALEYITETLHAISEYQENFDPTVTIEFTRNHLELPVLAVSFYMFFCLHIGPPMVKKPWNIKYLVAGWNFLLSIFSIVGGYYIIRTLYTAISLHGFHFSVCDGAEWYMHSGASGLYMFLFIYSKFFELLDTVFLVLKKKEVIFLHWFHHVTVLLYCWHSYATTISSGVWFAAMNYAVHSIMYMYYCLAILGYKWVFALNQFITTIQILQMVGGIAIMVYVAKQQFDGVNCNTDPANWKLGLAMYFSYFILFSMLFYDKYVKSGKSNRQSPCYNEPKKIDGAGFFHKNQDAKSEKKD